MAKFKAEVLEKIKSDVDLFAAVAKELNIKPTSLPQTLERNGNNLNQYSVVALVASRLGVEASELVEEELMGEQN